MEIPWSQVVTTVSDRQGRTGSIIDGKPTIDSLGVVTAVKSNKTGPSLIVGQDTEVTLSQIKKIQ